MVSILILLLAASTSQNLLPGSGFRSPDWRPYESGYKDSPADTRGGGFAIRCDSPGQPGKLGATFELKLDQTVPSAIQVTGWSRAKDVSGALDGDYAIYLDVDYSDGSHDYGLTSPFAPGTHGWQRRKVIVAPSLPIRSIHIYALFRNRTGTTWFDDFQAQGLGGEDTFDGQSSSVKASTFGRTAAALHSDSGLRLEVDRAGSIRVAGSGSRSGGFLVRDVAADHPATFLRGTVRETAGGIQMSGNQPASQLKWSGAISPARTGFWVDLDVESTSPRARALTLYFALPLNALGWNWGQDIRHQSVIAPSRGYANLVSMLVGAGGGISRYPFASVSNARSGYVVGTSLDAPSVSRLFYDGPTRLLAIAWDVALTAKRRHARVRGWIDALSPAESKWGFRAAATHFYRQFPAQYTKRVPQEGIWMPFADPSSIKNPEDFGFAFHEGDNSVAGDDRLGILSFRYTEPMSYWMPMAKSEPRTYDNAIRLLQGQAESGTQIAKATLTCGDRDLDGRLNLQFRNEPWCDGALFILDPDPHLPSDPVHPTKAIINYSPAEAARFQPGTRKGLDGEYLDSLESWGDTLDYDPTHMAACPFNLTFDQDLRPVLPQWFSTFAFTQWLATDLHRRGKLLMANTVPVWFSTLSGPSDVMGIETTWVGNDGSWQPDQDSTFNLRRTLSGTRPYLLLQNVDFSKFGPEQVEKYFQRCAFYGVFPSMFSVNAADHPYWEDPKLYNRDRPAFRQWIPVIKTLSSGGWQPITGASSDNPKVYVERYGGDYLALFNDSGSAQSATVSLDSRVLGAIKGVDTIAGSPGSTAYLGSTLKARLGPENCVVVKLRR